MRTPAAAVILETWGHLIRERDRMSMMDKLKHMLKGHEAQAEKAVDKAGDTVDERTQGKYAGQVDAAQEKAKDQFRDQPPQ
ncbi:hypothetical protein GCM10010505_61100 [Kitasatospora aburaviensis]